MVVHGTLPASLRGLFFVQNGPARVQIGNPLTGRGHVTCVDLSTGRVTEARVPPTHHAVTLDDVLHRRPSVLLSAIMPGPPWHSGTCNTAVVSSPDGARWYAVEEASRAYELRVGEKGLVEGRAGRFTGHREPVHRAPGLTYTYSPLSASPLRINGRAVRDWAPRERPVLLHSCARASSSRVVFPLMSTRYGGFDDWMAGRRPLPMRASDAGAGWLVHDVAKRETVEVPCPADDASSRADVFHMVRARESDGGRRMDVLACHVHGFEGFAHDASSPLRFSLEKHVLDLDAREVVDVVQFDDASGDFPNRVDARTVLINRMNAPAVAGGDDAGDAGGADDRAASKPGGGTRLVLFDVVEEAVVREVELPHQGVGDVLARDGRFLLYATLDRFVVYDLRADGVAAEVDIPPRAGNFHASLLRAPL